MGVLNKSMRLFGMPYQFSDNVDPRYKDVSGDIGRGFVNKIMTQAPVLYLVPGVPIFLPGETEDEVRKGISAQLLDVMQGNTGSFFNGTKNKDLRLYDFEEAYGEYMQYVNMMCRATASYMGLGQHIPMGGGSSASLQQYNWKDYGWDRSRYGGTWKNQVSYLWDVATGNNIFGKIAAAWTGNAVGGVSRGDSGTNAGDYNKNFVAFYVDPGSGSQTTFGNSTGQSGIAAMLDTASSKMKEWRFLMDTAGGEGIKDDMADIADSSLMALSDMSSNMGKFGKAVSRILQVGSSIVKGENVIIPEIYQDSDYSQSYNINISLRSPYGNRFAVFMDVIAPLLHLIALVAPRMGSANSYASPFLIKAYYPGVFNINLGIVDSLQITRPSNEDAWTVDGLPSEIEVTMSIKDLYSKFFMTKTSDPPKLFANNATLIDYLSTLAGVNLTQPQLQTKIDQWVNSSVTRLTDIPANAGAVVSDTILHKFLGIVSL